MDTPALIIIEKIAASFANSKGEYGKQNVYRYLEIILDGYRDWNIFKSNKTGTVNWYAGGVSSEGVIDWPSDLVDYVRIGTPISGQIYTLTRNDNIDIPIGIECGQVTGVDNPASYPIGEPLYWNWVTTDYASTGGHNFSYYREDKPNRRYVFNGDCVGRSIVIEYITSGISLSGETFIPVEMLTYLKLYLLWQLKFYAGDKDTEYYAREFAIKKDELMNFNWAFRPDEFMDMIRLTFTRAIKR